MDSILYRASLGSESNFYQQELASHNLANVNTPGFRADLFQAELQQVKGVNEGSYAFSAMKDGAVDTNFGTTITTGRDLNVAINGDGWFAIQDVDKKEGYTRNGSFKLDQNGMLTTSSGAPILGVGGPILIPPADEINIGTDGTISIIPVGAASNELVALDRLKLVKVPNTDLTKKETGLIGTKSGKPGVVDASVTVVSKTLENSNVNPIDQMVKLIEYSRQFESHMKIMDAVNQNHQRLAQRLQE